MIEPYETGVLYNSDEAKNLPNGMYIGLFHGRLTPDEELSGWGFDGPIIGPLKWVHTTYRGHVRFCPVVIQNGIDVAFDGSDLKFFEDMVEYKSKFYGDYTVFHHVRKESLSLPEARLLWKNFGDIPISEDGDIEKEFENFQVGTNREEIWAWFESKFDISVAKDLMYTRKQ